MGGEQSRGPSAAPDCVEQDGTAAKTRQPVDARGAQAADSRRETGPDGNIYLTTDEAAGAVLRIEPVEGATQ